MRQQIGAALLAVLALSGLAGEAAAQVLWAGGGGGERIAGRDRERAREACRQEARRRDFSVRETGAVRDAGQDRLRIRMELERRGDRWIGQCTYDLRDRRAELDVRRLDRSADRKQAREQSRERGRAADSRANVRDACARAAVPDSRYQILTMGRVRREGSVSFLPMTLLVESSQIDVRCVFDHRTGIATIPNLR